MTMRQNNANVKIGSILDAANRTSIELTPDQIDELKDKFLKVSICGFSFLLLMKLKNHIFSLYNRIRILSNFI